jgi:hypothetical protein
MQRHLSRDGLLIITNPGEYVAESLAASRLMVNQYNLFGYGYEGSTEYGDSLISRPWLEGFFAGQKSAIIAPGAGMGS